MSFGTGQNDAVFVANPIAHDVAERLSRHGLFLEQERRYTVRLQGLLQFYGKGSARRWRRRRL